MEILSCAFLIISTFVSISSVLIDDFSSLEVRFLLFLSFFLLFSAIFYFVRFNRRLETLFTLGITTSFIFILHNRSIFISSFSKSLATNEVVILARQYNATGNISLPSHHSYFLQTPYLVHVISTVFGIPPSIALYGIMFSYIALMTLIGMYILEILGKKGIAKPFSSSLIAFFVVSSNTMIVEDASFYRDMGSSLLLLLFCYFIAKPRRTRRDFLLMSILVVGATMGSPISSLIMILFFSILALNKHQRLISLFYAIIPLSYLTFVAHKYVSFLRMYTIFSFRGLLEFFLEIFSGSIPERVVPWRRTISSIVQDAFVSSISYISLLLLAMLTAGSILFLLSRDKLKRKKPEASLLKTFSIYLWITLVIIVITYIGASIRAETTFSDIRTVATIFLSGVLPFAFLSREFFEKLFSKKALSAIIAILMVLASFRVLYQVYPKSVHDPINVVEDSRLSQTIYDVGHYVNAHFKGGYFVVDFRMRIVMFSLFSSQQYEIRLLNEQALASALPYTTSVLVFHLNGVRYPSIYIPSEAYMEAYNLSLTRNRVYDNEDVVIVFIQLF